MLYFVQLFIGDMKLTVIYRMLNYIMCHNILIKKIYIF